MLAVPYFVRAPPEIPVAIALNAPVTPKRTPSWTVLGSVCVQERRLHLIALGERELVLFVRLKDVERARFLKYPPTGRRHQAFLFAGVGFVHVNHIHKVSELANVGMG